MNRLSLFALSVALSRTAVAAPRMLYLNFSDGTESLTEAEQDDATKNLSSIGSSIRVPIFTWPTITAGTTSRAAFTAEVARKVHKLFLPYNILITTRRPEQGPYDMAVITGSPLTLGFESGSAGVAFLDCTDSQPNNIVFAFTEALRGNEQALVVTIAQEAAHAFGLEHSSDPSDIMFPRSDPRQTAFLDQVTAVSGNLHCGNDTQNAHRKLLSVVGPFGGDEKPLDTGERTDKTAPTLTIATPSPGAQVTQPFVVQIKAQDDQRIDRVLLNAGAARLTLRDPPFAFSVSGLDLGRQQIEAVAYDSAGNLATATLSVTVTGTDFPQAPGCSLTGRDLRISNKYEYLVITVGIAARLLFRRRGRRRRS